MASKHMKRCSTSKLLVKVKVAQSCPTLCDPMDCSLLQLKRNEISLLCSLLYLKWITKMSYCIAQGTLLNVNMAAWMGAECRGEWIHVYVSSFVHEIITRYSSFCLYFDHGMSLISARRIKFLCKCIFLPSFL